MKKFIFSRIFLTAVVLIIFVIYFVLNIGQFKLLLHIDPLFLVLIALVDVFAIFINGLFTKFILRPFDKYISMKESFYVSLISAVGNFFAPAGAGLGFRAVYLKKQHDLSYGKYVSILSGNYILVFLVNSLAALLALYMLRGRDNARYATLVIIFGAIFIVSLVMTFIKTPHIKVERIKSRRMRSIVGSFSTVMQGWNHIISHRKLLARLIILTFVGLLINIVNNFLIIHTLNLHITFAPLLLLSVLGSLSLFINITPANLGVKEAIYLFSSSVIGFSTPQILSIALVDRVVLFTVLFCLWLYFSKYKHVGSPEREAAA
ncbi:MAG TPA: lysylphosphatidylglycerol synthase transmembrane domain-containing protein [Candidatus Saccharimonadales bacterium]|nr:lysylphosphatidylglycerol synthase transmembrane domain-containing protein [Candidatus Saccharimonadales bacterium]